ncbi:coiled-coil domain-containing protein 112-like [Euwallacea fornicatus]|uniref:coiled-coil domain-containing protein 112-like n=1 Tax=Euwallacea fornicatus TaxID=995702 RepID=UPI00338E1EBA
MLILTRNCEANKLENIIVTLENNVRNLIQKYDFGPLLADVPGLGESHRSKLRSQIDNSLRLNIQDITKRIKLKLDFLKGKETGEIKDFDAFKREMIGIQEDILNLKITTKDGLQRLENLENDLLDELDLYYNGKVAEWGVNLNMGIFEFIQPKIKRGSSRQCKEAREFFEFVHGNGGHENGWRQEDHLLFLKLRRKYGSQIDDLALHLHETLPDISVEDIKCHERWYQQYSRLYMKKEQAINQWKQEKSVINVDKRLEKSRKESECKSTNDAANALELKHKITKWKMEKEEKFLLDQEQEKQRALEKIEKERAKKQNQNDIRRIVNEWRRSKVILEQNQRHQQHVDEQLKQKRKAAIANRMLKHFRSMDEVHISKMRQIHQKIKAEPTKRAPLGPCATKDPGRLMQPTIQWTHRVNAPHESNNNSVQWSIFVMPKLGIPDWRKRVT